MKKLYTSMIIVMFIFICINMQVNGQNPVIDNNNQTSIDNVITSLKELNNDNNLTEFISTLERLSYQLTNSRNETLERTDIKVENLSSEEVVSVLDNVAFSINKLNYDNTFDSVITNLEILSKKYEGTSLDNVRENVK